MQLKINIVASTLFTSEHTRDKTIYIFPLQKHRFLMKMVNVSLKRNNKSVFCSNIKTIMSWWKILSFYHSVVRSSHSTEASAWISFSLNSLALSLSLSIRSRSFSLLFHSELQDSRWVPHQFHDVAYEREAHIQHCFNMQGKSRRTAILDRM